jgi:hypothetical protein
MFDEFDSHPKIKPYQPKRQKSALPVAIVFAAIAAVAVALIIVYGNGATTSQTSSAAEISAAKDAAHPERKFEQKQPKLIAERKSVQAPPVKEQVPPPAKPKSRDEQFADALKAADELIAKMKDDEPVATARRVRTLSGMESAKYRQYSALIEKKSVLSVDSYFLFQELEQMGLSEFVRLHRIMQSRDDPWFMKSIKVIWRPKNRLADPASLVGSMELWGIMNFEAKANVDGALVASVDRGIKGVWLADQRLWIIRLGGEAFLEELADRK